MTDTTDQQAVTVAQDDEWHRALAIKRYADPAVQRVSYLLACQLGLLGRGKLIDFHEGQCAISAAESMVQDVRREDARLASVSSASAELPGDVRALVVAAREFWDDENSGTVRSHALDKALEAFSSRVPYDGEPSPEPVPATNQAGEVEGLDAYDAGLLGDGGGGDVDWWQNYIRDELERAHEFYSDQVAGLTAPVTTMPEATVSIVARTVRQTLRDYGHGTAESSLPETIASEVASALAAVPTPLIVDDLSDALYALRRHLNLVGYAINDRNWRDTESAYNAHRDNLDGILIKRRRAALATQPATSQEGEWVTVPREPTQDQLIAGNGMFHTGEVPLNIYRAMIAATPTPPTLSEDLRDVARDALVTLDNIGMQAGLAICAEDGTTGGDVLTVVERLRAALAQVKAS